MKKYTAFVKDNFDKTYTMVTSEYNTKADFIKDLKANGYSVRFVSIADKFEENFNEYCEMKERGFRSLKEMRKWDNFLRA